MTKRPQEASKPPHNGRGSSGAGLAKTIALFAVFALPAGIVLSKMQASRQDRAEKATFRRLGLDWEQRARY